MKRMKRMKKEWTLRQLAAETGVPERTIRFYISRGLVDPPLRGGRGAAYGAGHKARLEDIKKLQAKGMMLAEIAHAIALASSEPSIREREEVFAYVRSEGRQTYAPVADAETGASPPAPANAPTPAPAFRLPGLPEPAVWRSYPVAPDVMVMVRAEAGPWRTKRILSALRQFAALVAPDGADRETGDARDKSDPYDTRENRDKSATSDARDDRDEQDKSIKGNKNDKDDKENQGE